MLKTTPMKRFYLAAPTKYEDRVIEDIGVLGLIQLTTDYTINGFRRVDTVERCEKYIKLQQRMASVLSALPPEQVTEKGLIQSLKNSFGRPVQKEIFEASLEEIESYVSSTETTIDHQLGMLENLRSELIRLRALEENLLILQRHAFKTNNLGDFEYVFVRAGFMNRAFSVKLERYVEGTSVRFAKWPEKREEDFVVIFGLNQDKPHIEETLVRLNFAELTLPEGINPDPTQALEETRTSASGIGKDQDYRGGYP